MRTRSSASVETGENTELEKTEYLVGHDHLTSIKQDSRIYSRPSRDQCGLKYYQDGAFFLIELEVPVN